MFARLFGPKATPEEQRIITWCKQKLSYTPKKTALFAQALTHSSALRTEDKAGQVALSNERLEFLGDAILAAVIADKLHQQYPDKTEGYLTRFRSRLVNRQTLNGLAASIDVHAAMRTEVAQDSKSSVAGNALEAVFGAIYLDKGYTACAKVITDLYNAHVDIDRLANTDSDKKSRLLEWGQKNKREVRFKLKEEHDENGQRDFRAEAFVDGKLLGFGNGRSKKRAEQEAAKYALRKLSGRKRKKKQPTR